MTKTDVFIRFRRSSVDGGKRCENANVDVNTFMRFQETENGGFRKRISVDGALISILRAWKMCIVESRNDRDDDERVLANLFRKLE